MTVRVLICDDQALVRGGFRAILDARPEIEVVGEAENGAGENAAFDRIYQQAVAEGISVFVAAGDSGAVRMVPVSRVVTVKG